MVTGCIILNGCRPASSYNIYRIAADGIHALTFAVADPDNRAYTQIAPAPSGTEYAFSHEGLHDNVVQLHNAKTLIDGQGVDLQVWQRVPG
jgi:hypothetical protein